MPTGSRRRPEGPAAELAGTLRAEISRRNLTYRAVAKAADIPETTLGPILRAEEGMTVDQLFVIARALELDPAWLIEDARQRARQPRRSKAAT